MKHKFSIIGCQHAHIGIFIQEMLELGHECVGLYETENIKLAKSVSDQYKIPIVSDLMSLLDASIDIVGCASINNEKIDIIELCEKHGKHVMIDKPAVTTRNAYERLLDVVERGKIQIGMMLTERYRASTHTLKRIIEQGELGEIISISMRKPHLLKPETRPLWHFSKEQGGGIVIDLFIHDFDLLRWLTGKEIISAEGCMIKNILPEHPSFYDVGSLQVLLEDHVMVQLYADWHTARKSWTYGDGRIFIVGTLGTAELRLEGDPAITKDELLIQVTHEREHGIISLDIVPVNVTEDFLLRIHGEISGLSHEDILLSTKASIEADEKVKLINKEAQI